MSRHAGNRGWRAALAIAALTLSCTPVSLDRGEPIDGRTDFMRAARTGGSTGTGSGGAAGGGAGNATASGGAGSAGSQGGAGGNADPMIDATPEDLRDARVLPALRDASAASCTDLQDWKPDFAYQPGAAVVHTTPRRRFKCRPWPNSGWCASAQYEPNGPRGFWPDAWIDEGLCP